MYYIGIDIGTSSVKTILIDEKGNTIKSVSREYPIYYPQPLFAEQNPDDWWRETKSSLIELVADIDRKKIRAMSMSGQMHGLVVLDKDDNIIRRAILWNDGRTEEECKYLNEDVGRDKISSYTGNIALTGFTGPKLIWMKKHEVENFNKIAKIMLPKDYLAYKLSGVFASDYSDSSGTLYLDVENKKWSEEMLELIGIDKEKLPKLYNSYDPIGYIRPELAEELDLARDVKIVIGGGDQAVAAVGGGIVGDGACSISLGTSGVVFANTDEFRVDNENRLHSFCNANGKFHLMGVTLAAAASLKWWVEDIGFSKDYDLMINEAEEASIDSELYFLPYLMGERTPHNDPFAKSLFMGMNMTTKRGDMTRAVLEGVAFSLRDTFEIMKDMNIKISEITINGGGARNEFWCQIIADVLNVKVNKVNSNDGPAYGAAILAAVGDGLFSTVDEACASFVKTTKAISPNKDNIDRYNQKYQAYKAIYPKIK